MGLFSPAQMDAINKVAQQSLQQLAPVQTNVKSNKITSQLNDIYQILLEYFKDSKAMLITTPQQLHDYVDKIIEFGYCSIDTETTGLDRIKDYMVSFSMYVPGMPECYVPMKHLIPIFDQPYKDQLTYEQVRVELQRIIDAKVRCIFANADFDVSFFYKDIHVDFIHNVYYDCILAWRCIKEDELHNGLKELYSKYVMRGKVDPKKFSDFFPPNLFIYCKPEMARLYAAHDAVITWDLFKWQIPLITPTSEACKSRHLEAIANLVWDIEMPLTVICQEMHRNGVYIDKAISPVIQKRYADKYDAALAELAKLVDAEIARADYSTAAKRPFKDGASFNPTSPMHVKYLVYTMMGISSEGSKGTGKEVLADLNLPITNQILKVRSLSVLINTFVAKMPKSVASDGKIHAQFKQIGAGTGRFSSQAPNVQNIPSHSNDIRHMFRATPSSIVENICEVDNLDATCTIAKDHYVEFSDGSMHVAETIEVGNVLKVRHANITTLQTISQLSVEDDGVHIVFHISSDPTVSKQNWKIHSLTAPYVMLSSDYSAQEPRLTAYVGNEPSMIKAFQEGRDVYASIASVAFGVPYENCLEFHPETHEYQPDGKARRGEAKTILLGITYGRSIPSIADQLYGKDDTMSDETKVKKAQVVFDSVMNAFPKLRALMLSTQKFAKDHGYVETILGRRRHLPDMQLPEFEFKALDEYVNPDIDPLDPSTLNNKSDIPERIVKKLTEEFSQYKYFGQIAKRTKELYAQHIKVINNRPKINDATRQCLNSVIQGEPQRRPYSSNYITHRCVA